jgi:hypothetical protein
VATNASSVATASIFTANTTAGTYNVVASLSATPAVTRNLALTNNPGNPASLTVVAVTNNQSTVVNTAFGSTLQATLKDSGGNVITTAYAVTFTAPAAGASAVFGGGTNTFTVNSGAGGLVDSGGWDANTVAGANYTIKASVSLFPAVTVNFTATNTADVAANIAAVNGAAATTQSTNISTAFGVGMSVLVTDQFGNPVSGANVRFTRTTVGGASGTFVTGTPFTLTTGATGIVNPGTFTANGTAGGPYTVTATVTGVGPPAVRVTFNLTNI